MGEIVNLRRVKKARARAEQDMQAVSNRVLHGRTRADRELTEAERRRQSRAIDNHRVTPSEASGLGRDGETGE